MAWLLMRDFLTVAVKETEVGKQHLFECRDNESPTGSSLLIKAEATHAAIINGNMRFYRPDRMQSGAHTWTPEPGFARLPVLRHHDSDQDPIGRVHGSRYVDDSYQFTNLGVRKLLFYDGQKAAKKFSLYESVDWVVDHLVARPQYHGLGHIDLDLNIQDPKAIQKIQDGRYITVSVGFRTDSAICSVCHTDWAVDEQCDHALGAMVDGRRMFLIAGNLKYRECSFVNFPADPWGQIKTGSDALKTLADSLENRIFWMGLDMTERTQRVAYFGLTDTVFTDALSYQADIRVEDDDMDLEAILQEITSDGLTKERALELRGQLSLQDQTLAKAALATLNAKIRVSGWADETPSKETVQTKIDSLSVVLPTLSTEARANYVRQLADQAKAADVEFTLPLLDEVEEFEDQWREWKAEGDDSEFFGRNEEALYADLSAELESADAKYSTEARKKMKGSSFCGPNRSFPVTDCAHVTAARRLIGKAKVSDSTKEKILACVSNKAESLGCGGKDTEEQKTVQANATHKISDSAPFKEMIDHWVESSEGDEKKPFPNACKMVQYIDDTHMLHEGLLAHERPHFIDSMWRLQNVFSATGSLNHAKEYIAGRAAADAEVPFTVILKKDLETLHTAVGKYEDALLNKQSEIAMLLQVQKAVLADAKMHLATVVVLGGVMLGDKSFDGMDAAQIQEEIRTRSKRSLDSLKDSVSDLEKKLPTLQAASGEKPVQVPVHEVSDSATVTVPATTDEPVEDQQEDLGIALQLLTPRERSMYFARRSTDRLQQQLAQNQ